MVLVVQEGWGASTAATKEPGAAIDSAIVGVVDYIDLLPREDKGVGR
jgi:microcompartment protein CcmK/EutM